MNRPIADVDLDVDATCVKSYLICAAPRTGSGLLSSMLTDTALAGHPGEFMRELTMQEFFARAGRPLALDEYLNSLKKRRCSKNGVFGFKAKYDQLNCLFPDVVVQREFIEKFDRIVLVYSNDVLAQAISHYRAILAGVSQEAAERSLSVGGAIEEAYDAAEIAKHLSLLIEQSESWRRLLRKCEADWLEIAYEDLIRDPVGMLFRVMQYLGIEVEALPKAPRPRPGRQADKIDRAWRDRFVADLLGAPGGSFSATTFAS